MDLYTIRKATKDDIDKIVEIYNSNRKFLINHLGTELVDDNFINNEISEMDKVGFLSCVIINVNTGEIIGVLDYKPDNTVYLSLIMLDSKFHGKGLGTLIYSSFEKDMIRSEKQSIRIDVVNDYEGNVVGFWKKQAFISQKDIQLEWGNKKSSALLMTKSLK